MNTRKTGAEYEQIAAEYLQEKGYHILERNFRCRYGEIDLIAEQGETLVYVEIKYRGSMRCGNPLEAVDSKKQRRICKTAMYYYTYHGYEAERPCRFDVIGIDGNGAIMHLENAFEFHT